jgi:hypothetical protein
MRTPINLILQPFSLGHLQDAVVMFKALSDAGYSVDDLSEYVTATVQVHKDIEHTAHMEVSAHLSTVYALIPNCPDCGKKLTIMDVNTTKCNQIGGTAKSMWQCGDIFGCGYETESDNGRMEELEKLGIPKMVAPMQPQPSVRDSSMRRRAASHVSRQAAAPVAKKPCGGCR